MAYNEILARVMSSSKCFVGVQGGGSYLQAYFGGVQTILHVGMKGKEYKTAYSYLFPSLSGQEIKVAWTMETLVDAVRQMLREGRCG